MMASKKHQKSRGFSLNIFKKLKVLIIMGLFVGILTACGGSSNNGSDSNSVEESINSAISPLSGVLEVETRYNKNIGMGATLSIRIQAETEEVTLEDVMTESLVSLSDAISDSTMNPQMGISFQVTEVGQDNTINPTSVGLPQRPTISEIHEFSNNEK